jgi:hypothetical protein
VKDRVGRGIENMDIIVNHQRERNHKQYVAVWNSQSTTQSVTHRTYSQAAQVSLASGGQRNRNGGREVSQGNDNTVSTMGGGAQSGSQEATIVSMAASIEGLQAFFQKQQGRSSKMESLIAEQKEENKKLKESLAKSDEKNK